jgi:hypothetical protein
METNNTTIRVKKTSRATINEFCARTHTDVIDFMEQLTTELQKSLDVMEDGKRLLYLIDFDPKVRWVHIRLSDAFDSSLAEIPEDLRTEIFEKFGYRVVNGRFVDLREKPEEKKEEKQ